MAPANAASQSPASASAPAPVPRAAAVLTIGHSTRPIEVFVELLQRHDVALLADVRRFPGSRTQPQFGGDALAASLRAAGIGYQWFEALGGRRRPRPDSHNTRWRNVSFRGYADYMETPAFATAFDRLTARADTERTAIMCAELLWWRCHRALVSDALQAGGRPVSHIGPDGALVAHPWTGAARLDHGRLRYDDADPQPSLDL
jgi:uncharacterized protein (DUF488 family)